MSREHKRVTVNMLTCDTKGCGNIYSAFFTETGHNQLENEAARDGWTKGGYTIDNEQDWYHGVFIPKHACPDHELEPWLSKTGDQHE